LFEEFLQSQTVLTRHSLELEFDQKITIPEYVGGLSDLTGEIGRIAVLYGTSRDLNALTPVHRFCDAISRGLSEITLSTGKFYQKSTTARQNTSKIEGLIYELTMNMKSERGIHRPLNVLEGNTGNSKEERGGGGGDERNEDEEI
jgi:predicted translin family RNA/ssDNA-binding protein